MTNISADSAAKSFLLSVKEDLTLEDAAQHASLHVNLNDLSHRHKVYGTIFTFSLKSLRALKKRSGLISCLWSP